MKEYKNESEVFDEARLLKINSLKKGIEVLKDILKKLEDELSLHPEKEELKPQIARYRESVRINEEELETLGVDILNNLETGSKDN